MPLARLNRSRLAAAWGAAFLVSLAVCMGTGSTAKAQLHRATDSVATPASSLVLLDDALAIDINPAAIGGLQSYSVAVLHSDVDQRQSWLARGDALYAATPVIGPLAVGVTLQSIRPGSLALRPKGESGPVDRAMAALSLAISPSSNFSFGLTTRTFSSSNARFDGLTAVDVGVLLRPSNWLGVSVVGRDLFVSRHGFGTGELRLGSSLMVSAALRPLGSEALTFDFDMIMDANDASRLSGRGGMVVDLPYLGTAAAMIESPRLGDARSALRVVAELAVNLGRVGAVGGLAQGDGIESTKNWYAMLRADGEQRRGLPLQAQVLDLEVESVTPRSMISLALSLEEARTDPRIAGVLLRPRGGAMGLAYAQEIRLQVASLRRAGKPVVCHLNSASGSEYYACAGADRILIDPAGDVRLMGVSTTVMLFGELLQKIGVRADFVRIGRYKSAPEEFTQSQLGESAREDTNALLDDSHHRLLVDLSSDLHVPEARVAELIDQAPFLAHAAVKAGLAGAAADENELDDDMTKVFEGRRVTRSLPARQERAWGKKKPVIASMGSMAASGGYYVASAADEIWADPTTLTGSIGIFYGKVDVQGLADILGIHIENFGRGKRAGGDTIYRPFTDDERAALADVMRSYYKLFLSRVAEGRGMSVEAVDAVARGRVHSGDAAQRLGLVDRLGGFASALMRARERAGPGSDSEVIVRPLRKTKLLDYVLGASASAAVATGSSETTSTLDPLQLAPQLRSLLRAVATLQTLGQGEPLALLPFDAQL